MTGPRWRAVWGWLALILVGTSIPGHELPPAFPHADKLVHLLMYGVLGWLLARAALGSAGGAARVRRAGLALAAAAGFAAFDEWHQDYVPGRSADRADWLADVAGVGAGLLMRFPQRSEQRI